MSMKLMTKDTLVERLTEVHPGWHEWDSLIELVTSLEFSSVSLEYVGEFLSSGSRLTFASRPSDQPFPDFVPSYLAAIFGMKVSDAETAGGFAEYLSGAQAKRGALFNPAGLDEMMGYPVFDVPLGTYCFQANSSGASFFINQALEVLYPNSDLAQFSVLDPLDEFARTCIRKAVLGEDWFSAYAERVDGLID